MPITHKNCRGQTYFLHEGKTKTGKPKYFVSQKAEGNLPEAVPDGYEIYERPGGLVFVRRIQTPPILPVELKYVQDKIAPLVNQEDEKEYPEWRSVLRENFAGFVTAGAQAFVERFRTRYQAEIRKKEIII